VGVRPKELNEVFASVYAIEQFFHRDPASIRSKFKDDPAFYNPWIRALHH
jgi:hypothetical protein